ncbi:MAG: adenylate/guanylate cyclase domain-containing protein [Chloroflexota bacterium]
MKSSTAEMNVRELEPFETLQEWNRTLIEKVSQQMDLIERMSRLKRYLPPHLADSILKSDDPDLFKSHRREITAIFLDLRGFTAFSDSAEPEEVMALLRSYHTEMGRLIFEFGGTVEHFIADGLMVFFNAPVPCEDHTETAVKLTLAMRDRVKELRTEWCQKGYDLDLGIGLAAGYAAVGNIGFEGQMDYGAVGNVTNLASRLCGAAKGGQILTDQKTLTQITNSVETEPLEELYLKGFIRPVRAFNIVGLRHHRAGGEPGHV